MKYLAFLLILVLTLAPFSVRYWPSGKAQDVAYLWLNDEALSQLSKKALESDFATVNWCSDSSMVMENFEFGNGAERSVEAIREFKEAANDYGLDCYSGRFIHGKWYLRGSSGGANNSQVSRLYVNQDNLEIGCTDKVIEGASLKTCTSHLFGNWYLVEETLSYSFAGV